MQELLEEKIERIAKEEAEMRSRRFEAYWAEHQAEKEAFEKEKTELQTKITDLQKKLTELPEVRAEKALEAEFAALEAKKAALGILKIKEKMAVQEDMDRITFYKKPSVVKAREEAMAPFEKEIKDMEKRIAEIDDELTKNR